MAETIGIQKLAVNFENECVAFVDDQGNLVTGEIKASFQPSGVGVGGDLHVIIQATTHKPQALWVTRFQDGRAEYKASDLGVHFMGWFGGTKVIFKVEKARNTGTRWAKS